MAGCRDQPAFSHLKYSHIYGVSHKYFKNGARDLKADHLDDAWSTSRRVSTGGSWGLTRLQWAKHA